MLVVKLDNNNHSVFLLYYHLVLVVKYRCKLFCDQMSQAASYVMSEGIRTLKLKTYLYGNGIVLNVEVIITGIRTQQ